MMSEKIALREVGMRDGLQSIATIMPTETKIAWLDAEYAAGVRYVEVSSFVPPKLLPQLADAEAVIAHAMTLPGLHVSALIPNSRGAERGSWRDGRAGDELRAVGVERPQSVERAPLLTEESIERFPPRCARCSATRATSRSRINCRKLVLPRSAARSKAMSGGGDEDDGCAASANEIRRGRRRRHHPRRHGRLR